MRDKIVEISLDNVLYNSTLADRLREHAPRKFYAIGNATLFAKPCCAVVGARDACEETLEFARKVAMKIVRSGRIVVSGMARGVDTAAMVAALKAGGSCVAIVPQGVMTIRLNDGEYRKAFDEGRLLIMSTLTPQTAWNRINALERNHYIYGMAETTYIAQTNTTGGTWNGAMFALKYHWHLQVFDYPCQGNQRLLSYCQHPLDKDGFALNYQNDSLF